MARKRYPLERRKNEGMVLEKYFSFTKATLPNFTRRVLMDEMQLNPSLFSQWVSGVTRISDEHFLYLGAKLGFDPIVLRPELSGRKVAAAVRADAEVLDKLRAFPLWKKTLVFEFIDVLEKY